MFFGEKREPTPRLKGIPTIHTHIYTRFALSTPNIVSLSSSLIASKYSWFSTVSPLRVSPSLSWLANYSKLSYNRYLIVHQHILRKLLFQLHHPLRPFTSTLWGWSLGILPFYSSIWATLAVAFAEKGTTCAISNVAFNTRAQTEAYYSRH